jgi:DNA repair protein RadA
MRTTTDINATNSKTTAILSDDNHSSEVQKQTIINSSLERGYSYIRERLDKAGIKSIKEIAIRGAVDISKETGLDSEECSLMCNWATLQLEQQGIIPKRFSSAAQLYENRRNSAFAPFIPTGSKELDKLFGEGNGIETGALTEFYGASATGKTQICFTLCAMVQHELNGKAIYIDTENSFRPERIEAIANARGFDSQRILKNIHIVRALNSSYQEYIIKKAIARFIEKEEKDIKLLVVDSMIAHYRAEFSGRAMLSERQQRLNNLMSTLSRIAQVYKIAVVVTNQIQATPDDLNSNRITPIGGNVMEHASTYRINLRHHIENSRTARLVKSPCHCNVDAEFAISDKGVSDLK